MMRRKIIIVLTITFMVTLMVTSFSLLYLSQILRLRLNNAYESSTRLAQQLAYTVENDVPDLTSTPIDTSDPAALRKALTDYLPTDVNLLNNLESAGANCRFVYDASIVSVAGGALIHTNASLTGKVVRPRADFRQVLAARLWDQPRLVYRPGVYDLPYPLLLNGSDFGTIRIGVST